MTDDIPQCSVERLAERRKATPEGSEPDFLLLDVRETWEREIASIDGALTIVMNDIPDQIDAIREAQGNRELIVFCHTGKRSMVIAKFLKGNEFQNVTNLTGGIDAWSQHIHASRHLY
ncbi:MAG: rhodanese-like domain-containing protein [Gammaproteobacteria bacterium]